MARPPTEVEIRKQLEKVLNEPRRSYTWVTGGVEFELRSDERIKGQLQYLEPASAIIDGPRGSRRC